MNDDNGSGDYASSPCMAHESIDNSVDQGNEVLVELLQLLLAGERAGARIARESHGALPAQQVQQPVGQLIEDIQTDEVRYCQMLMSQLRRLGVEPDQGVGDFYEKCMAIDDLKERLLFLNRGQEWVIRKIEQGLPDVRDVQLSSELAEMRDTHKTNVQRTLDELSKNSPAS